MSEATAETSGAKAAACGLLASLLISSEKGNILFHILNMALFNFYSPGSPLVKYKIPSELHKFLL